MTIHELAEELTRKLEPSIYESLELSAKSKNPEIILGRKVQQDRLDRMIRILSKGIQDNMDKS
jgi:hypothetical protein